jgi:hypothetical protein
MTAMPVMRSKVKWLAVASTVNAVTTGCATAITRTAARRVTPQRTMPHHSAHAMCRDGTAA